jgi:hypothetical protein
LLVQKAATSKSRPPCCKNYPDNLSCWLLINFGNKGGLFENIRQKQVISGCFLGGALIFFKKYGHKWFC